MRTNATEIDPKDREAARRVTARYFLAAWTAGPVVLFAALALDIGWVWTFALATAVYAALKYALDRYHGLK